MCLRQVAETGTKSLISRWENTILHISPVRPSISKSNACWQLKEWQPTRENLHQYTVVDFQSLVQGEREGGGEGREEVQASALGCNLY